MTYKSKCYSQLQSIVNCTVDNKIAAIPHVSRLTLQLLIGQQLLDLVALVPVEIFGEQDVEAHDEVPLGPRLLRAGHAFTCVRGEQ